MQTLAQLFANNRAWAAGRVAEAPDFFTRLVAQQSPAYLWIGCADSRVPANEIVGLDPGELFVHRNVANIVTHTDVNCLSVLQYAVDVLGVRHVIVCGHYGCGGVRAVLEGSARGVVRNWLGHVEDVWRLHRGEIDPLPDAAARVDRLCELNVAEQTRHVARSSIVQDAWRRGQPLDLHAWIYRLSDGLLRDLAVSTDAERPTGC